MVNEISGVYNGSRFTLEYFEREVENRDSKIPGATKLYPNFHKLFTMKGKRATVRLDENLELAVYSLLYPECADSPIRSIGDSKSWQVYNHAGRVKKQQDTLVKVSEIMAEILAEQNLQKIVNIARGMQLKTARGGIARISDDLSKNPVSAKIELIKLLQSLPEQFIAEYRSETVYMRGRMEDFIANGKTKLLPLANGHSQWVWAETGEKIVAVTPGQNPRSVLFSWMAAPGNQELLLQGEHLNDTQAAEASLRDSPKIEVVRRAANSALIRFFPGMEDGKHRVFAVDEDGQKTGNAIRIIVEPDDWMKEIAGNDTAMEKVYKLMEKK